MDEIPIFTSDGTLEVTWVLLPMGSLQLSWLFRNIAYHLTVNNANSYISEVLFKLRRYSLRYCQLIFDSNRIMIYPELSLLKTLFLRVLLSSTISLIS